MGTKIDSMENKTDNPNSFCEKQNHRDCSSTTGSSPIPFLDAQKTHGHADDLARIYSNLLV